MASDCFHGVVGTGRVEAALATDQRTECELIAPNQSQRHTLPQRVLFLRPNRTLGPDIVFHPLIRILLDLLTPLRLISKMPANIAETPLQHAHQLLIVHRSKYLYHDVYRWQLPRVAAKLFSNDPFYSVTADGFRVTFFADHKSEPSGAHSILSCADS
jgi:hypothetical protein